MKIWIGRRGVYSPAQYVVRQAPDLLIFRVFLCFHVLHVSEKEKNKNRSFVFIRVHSWLINSHYPLEAAKNIFTNIRALNEKNTHKKSADNRHHERLRMGISRRAYFD